jgi:hypothetical protein
MKIKLMIFYNYSSVRQVLLNVFTMVAICMTSVFEIPLRDISTNMCYCEGCEGEGDFFALWL